jgi:hypothetical protein
LHCGSTCAALGGHSSLLITPLTPARNAVLRRHSGARINHGTRCLAMRASSSCFSRRCCRGRVGARTLRSLLLGAFVAAARLSCAACCVLSRSSRLPPFDLSG